LLADQPDWTDERIAETREGDRPRTVQLKEPMQVLLLYWTALPGDDGTVLFTPDVYDRDAAVLAALDGDFFFRIPRGAPDYGQ
jgi:murein L,D-transpeptidase YcbB/YkuD